MAPFSMGRFTLLVAFTIVSQPNASLTQQGKPQPLRLGEVGRQRPLEFLHHRQPPFHFSYDAALLGEGQQGYCELSSIFNVEMR